MNTYDGALDPLDVALQNFTANGPSGKIVDTLIKAGARIKYCHEEIVNGMASNQLEEYLYLINRYPFLKNSLLSRRLK